MLFRSAVIGFGFIPQQFFPSSDRPELMVDMRLPEGASYAATLTEAKRMEQYLKGKPGIENYVSYVGTGAPRFYLPLDQQLPQRNFAQLVVLTDSVKTREALREQLMVELDKDFPNVQGRVTRLENGPPVGFPVQFRVSGDDITTVRAIAAQVADVIDRKSVV